MHFQLKAPYFIHKTCMLMQAESLNELYEICRGLGFVKEEYKKIEQVYAVLSLIVLEN